LRIRCRLGRCALCILLSSSLGSAIASGKGGSVHPVVCNDMLLGGSSGGRWLSSSRAGKSVRGGELYKLYTLRGRGGQALGSKASTAGSASGAQLRVILRGSKAGDGVALCAGWNAQPRVIRRISVPRPRDLEVARSVLAAHGMGAAPIHVDQVVETDLRGDGTRYVLLAATTSRAGLLESDETPNRNDYSFVAAYRPSSAEIPRLVGTGYFAARKSKPDTGAERFRIVAVADLNGDGAMEVIVSGEVYEGSEVSVYSVGASGFKRALSAGDGV
jgi:hypothetical protein